MNEQKTHPATPHAQDAHPSCERLRPTSDLIDYARRYVREKPEVVALCCVGIGFVLGWKLKPW
ncbi:MAG: hypothetical protein ABI614_04555 [Planctomycetota bacterium]